MNIHSLKLIAVRVKRSLTSLTYPGGYYRSGKTICAPDLEFAIAPVVLQVRDGSPHQPKLPQRIRPTASGPFEITQNAEHRDAARQYRIRSRPSARKARAH